MWIFFEISVPSGAPKDMFASVQSRNLTLFWSPPLRSQRNGVIISYLITCSSGDIIINTTRTSSTSLTITGLQPFTNYSCSIIAHTSVGGGPAATINATTRQDGKSLFKQRLFILRALANHKSISEQN